MGPLLYWLLVVKLVVIIIAVTYLLLVLTIITWLNVYALSSINRFDKTGGLADIDKAIVALQVALRLPISPMEFQSSTSHNLGAALVRRFTVTSDLNDICASFLLFKKAGYLLPRGHPSVPDLHSMAGTTLLFVFQRSGNVSYLDLSIVNQREAVLWTSESHADLPRRLATLGSALMVRFGMTGNPDDVTEARAVLQRAVNLVPQGHEYQRLFFTALGSTYHLRFAYTCDLQDLARGISTMRTVLALAFDGDADMPCLLSELGTALCTRVDHTGEARDIEEAISLQRRAVQIASDGHPSLPICLSMLGRSLRSRFERSGELRDIDEAISLQQRAVQRIPQNGGDPMILGDLGVLFSARFERTGDMRDSQEAISAIRRALAFSGSDRGDKAGWLLTLSIVFYNRFDHTADVLDIDQAISAGRRAVELIPEGLSTRTNHFLYLGRSLYRRSKLSGSVQDLRESISHFQEGATCGLGRPLIRLAAAKQWARALIRHHPDSPDILVAYETIMHIFSVVAGPEHMVERRFTQLEGITEAERAVMPRYYEHQDMSSNAQEAAAAACQLGRVDKALEWLERGRCLVWGQLKNLRTPVEGLEARDSRLAQRFINASRRLENAGLSRGRPRTGGSMSGEMSVDDEALAHANLAAEWNDTIKAIRAIPGFESFLQPLSCATLVQHLPTTGPIVVLNVDGLRCDAIALLHGRAEPLHIPLPHFSLDKAKMYRGDLTQAMARRGLRDGVPESSGSRAMVQGMGEIAQSESPVSKVLQSLWSEVVKPILDALGIPKSRGDSSAQPRIWWCPTGVMSFLPIHAAGNYHVEQPEALADYAISSYTPTIDALTRRIESHHLLTSDDSDSSGLFLTCQPTAIASSPIYGTTAEVATISRKARDHGVRSLKVDGDDLSIDECLGYMQEYSSVHLACHAKQNAADPLQSRFLFQKGQLPLATILQTHLPNADLAYLSACQTSAGEERLSDESVHLAAGMLAAGYRRVVATMWAIGDEHAQAVATDFYEYLWSRRNDDSGSGFDGSLSAEALHYAVGKLRRDIGYSERSLLAWIPFVHFGH